jgi:hypothetical protein
MRRLYENSRNHCNNLQSIDSELQQQLRNTVVMITVAVQERGTSFPICASSGEFSPTASHCFRSGAVSSFAAQSLAFFTRSLSFAARATAPLPWSCLTCGESVAWSVSVVNSLVSGPDASVVQTQRTHMCHGLTTILDAVVQTAQALRCIQKCRVRRFVQCPL